MSNFNKGHGTRVFGWMTSRMTNALRFDILYLVSVCVSMRGVRCYFRRNVAHVRVITFKCGAQTNIKSGGGKITFLGVKL